MISKKIRDLCINLKVQITQGMVSKDDIEMATRTVNNILAETDRIAALEEATAMLEAS